MKRNLFLLIFLISAKVLSQETLQDSIFSNTHGLKQDQSLYIEVEGYSIFTYIHNDLFFDNTGIRIAKRKYGIDKSNIGYVDSTVSIKHKAFIVKHKVTDDLSEFQVYYLTALPNNKIKVIGFSVNSSRDTIVERILLHGIINNSIPAYVITNSEMDSVNFAGRSIHLGSACRWMNPHNIQCPDFGQMNWSEFRSMKRAKEMLDAQNIITANRKLGEVLQSDIVDVVFEGNPAKALKIKYKIKIPRLIMGGSNILIIYYVACEVRGKYVACVMSQYTDDVHRNGLAPLLNEVMQLTGK